MFGEWRRAFEQRGLKVNLEKTTLLVMEGEMGEVIQVGRLYRWGGTHVVCAVKVLQSTPFCATPVISGVIRDGVIGVVTQFCYLGDVLDSEGGVERAVRARLAAAWGKKRVISGLLLNKGIPLARRGMVFDACIRSVMLYGGETWALTKRLESVVVGCDHRMLRCMAVVTRQDWVSSEEVARRCGVGMLEDALLRRRLGWFGHVERRDERDTLGRVWLVEAPGCRQPGRPKKTWKKNMEEELNKFQLCAVQVQDRSGWRTIIDHLTL